MARQTPDKAFWMASLRAEGAAFAAAVAGSDPAAPVPTRPGWCLADLVADVGSGYEWVRGHVNRGVTSAPEPRPEVSPGTGSALLDWWRDRFGALVDLLEVLDGDMPAWNWAPRAKVVAFWHRRIAHETALYRWDAQFATVSAEPIEERLATDGVAEVLDTWLPAGRARHPDSPNGVAGLHTADGGHEWYLRLRSGGGVALLDTATLLDTAEHHERVVVQGSASDLLLALHGRVGFDVLSVSGDERLLRGLLVG